MVVSCVASITDVYSADLALNGVVTSTSGEALVGVTIVIDGSNRGVTTDQNGRYSIRINSGDNKMIVSCIGYVTQEKEINVSKNTTLNFSLEEDAMQINDVVVYGESNIQRVKNTAFAVNAIDIASIAGSVQTLSDVVTRSLGVHIRRNGGVGSDYELTLNGMDGSSINYFLDGVPLDAYGSNFNLDNIPPSIVDRIEIYKGVVPAYLGGDALGGAINIITKQGIKNYYDISYGIGSFHTHQVDASAYLSHKKTGLTIKPTFSMSYSKNDYTMKDMQGIIQNDEGVWEYVTDDYKRFHDDYRSLFGQVEAGVSNKKWADQFYVSTSINNVDKDIQTGARQEVVYGAATTETMSKSFGIRYLKKGLLVDGLTLNLNASYTKDNTTTVDTMTTKTYYWNGFGRDTNTSSGSAEMSSTPAIIYYDRPYTTARANVDYNFGKWGSLNANYLLTISSSMTDSYRPYEDIEWEYADSKDILRRQYAGLTYSVDLFNKWNNNIFVKEYVNKVMQKSYEATVEDSSSTTNFTSYGVGSRYKFFDEFAIKASYEYSVSLPGVTQLLGNGISILANTDLTPQKSYNYNLSIYGNVRHKKSLFTYEIGGFHRDIQDYFMVNVVSEYGTIPETYESEDYYMYSNLSQVWISGAEIELKYLYSDRVQTSINFSYEKAIDMLQYDVDTGEPSFCYKMAIPNRPSLYGNASVGYVFKNLMARDDKLMLEYRYEYVHWYYLTWGEMGSEASRERIPTQHCHSVSATYSWHKSKYSVSASCDNMFDYLLYDNYKLQKPGRSYYLKLRCLINEP